MPKSIAHLVHYLFLEYETFSNGNLLLVHQRCLQLEWNGSSDIAFLSPLKYSPVRFPGVLETFWLYVAGYSLSPWYIFLSAGTLYSLDFRR